MRYAKLKLISLQHKRFLRLSNQENAMNESLEGMELEW